MTVTMILVTLLKQELRLRFRKRNFGSATLLINEKRSHLIVVAAEEELDGGDHDLGDLAAAGISAPAPEPKFWLRNQGFGSGSGLDPYSIGPLDPDPDP
jgi:hypothetical protein